LRLFFKKNKLFSKQSYYPVSQKYRIGGLNRMKIGEKMFPGSIVALLLGVFLAAPLLYTNVAIEPVAAGSEQLLCVELTYAYLEQITGTYVPHGGFLPDSENPNATESGLPRTNYFVACNLTRLSEEVDPCDAKLLVYLVKFYSDNGFVGNLGLFEGIIYNSDLMPVPGSGNETAEGLIYTGRLIEIFNSEEFFGDHHPFQAGGSFGTWNVGESRTGSSSGFWDSGFEEPGSIFVSMSLLGWVAQRGNSTDAVILEEPQVVAEAQLEKFGDGFLYNNLIPEDELSGLDPLNPYGKLFEQMGDLD
jgi:hypothetical protein